MFWSASPAPIHVATMTDSDDLHHYGAQRIGRLCRACLLGTPIDTGRSQRNKWSEATYPLTL